MPAEKRFEAGNAACKVEVFGIRHYGPGSARSLIAALEIFLPDIVLIEGPPDADALLKFAIHPDMKPPVALLVYDPTRLTRAACYPFAEFSPEWRAIRFALERGLPARFIDLPVSRRFALETTEAETEGAGDSPPERMDPIRALAQAAGFDDGERWWECMVERRRDARDIFAAIVEGVGALREDPAFAEAASGVEGLREPHMRQCIRTARKEGFRRIAVVCGAFHAPALAAGWETSERSDAAQLKGLAKVRTHVAWIPWTHGRLAARSGYGAGVVAPGWYWHLWETDRASQTKDFWETATIRWVAKAAQALRAADFDASPAQAVETVRLADALAALRNAPSPGVDELNEAIAATLCGGDAARLAFIHERLIVAERLGSTPAEAPTAPLQEDIQRESRRLRLPAEATTRVIDLDLRESLDLGRSRLLHRLALLGVPWGERQEVEGRLGTFHEYWRLQWKPEFALKIVEMAVWGNTAVAAASAFTCHKAKAETLSLAQVIEILDGALAADLPAAAERTTAEAEARAAVAGDVAHCMDALPRLAKIRRYGSVRRVNVDAVRRIADVLAVRVCVGLPAACASLTDEAAEAMERRMCDVQQAMRLLRNAERLELWRGALNRIVNTPGVHGVIVGRCARMLFDDEAASLEETRGRLSRALSAASDPTFAAAWVEGFFKGSGLALAHDDALRRTFDDWLTQLSPSSFHDVSPLLRRTFATFSVVDRRRIAERARETASNQASDFAEGAECDAARADAALAVVAVALGVEKRLDA
jgi:hypothetical protein